MAHGRFDVEARADERACHFGHYILTVNAATITANIHTSSDECSLRLKLRQVSKPCPAIRRFFSAAAVFMFRRSLCFFSEFGSPTVLRLPSIMAEVCVRSSEFRPLPRYSRFNARIEAVFGGSFKTKESIFHAVFSAAAISWSLWCPRFHGATGSSGFRLKRNGRAALALWGPV